MRLPSFIQVMPLLFVGGTACAADLSLSFSGLPSDKGKLMVAVYNSEATYKAKEAIFKTKLAANGPLQTVFKDLPPGHYAVTVYHDENENGSMDKNFMGIPREAYGFSRNPNARFGAPPFAEMAFALDKETVQLDILVE